MSARAVLGRGRRRSVLACGLAGALALAAALAGEPAAARDVRSDPRAVALLRAAADAASRVPYQGRRFLTTASRSRSMTSRVSVAHTPGDGIRYRSGTAQRGYRPESAAGDTTGFTPETLALLTRNYSVVRAEDSAVCGRRARVVEARRADGSPAGRFWIDAETGLMLHRELIDATGRAVVMTGFTEISFTEPPPEPAVLDGPRNGLARFPGRGGTRSGGEEAAAQWGDELDRADLDGLRELGWPVPDDLPGRLTLHDARRDAGGGTVHLSYSDGLAAVSVFVQPGRLDEAAMDGWQKTVRRGRTVYRAGSLRHWAVSADDGYVVTVLTDAPQSTAEAVAAHLPREADPFWSRLSRGARRLTAAANPFD
ncbi:MucB/RseB C-terminal domain-containing protein [Actinomadura livida]|uniref:Sigma-E factor negative regulatory protein RseB n=1 Tax=Actinomadura livida TaxID=79909 RepID=A0A7W7IAH7_9ACTN|nr:MULTISPECIES: MucB/RseB C-terminal domain-containing protein [Actinomadura]MBB4773444.1 sigma-E factor negative regulatory protein RseB [Actinomadura catellatispora]